MTDTSSCTDWPVLKLFIGKNTMKKYGTARCLHAKATVFGTRARLEAGPCTCSDLVSDGWPTKIGIEAAGLIAMEHS
jgi:hypothetical protein